MGGLESGAGGGIAQATAPGRAGLRLRDLVAGPGHAVASLALAGIAAAYAWSAPSANGLAAGALLAALALDASGRLAVARAERLSGIAVRFSKMPSLALPLGGAAGLGLLAVALLGCPRAFAPLAGAGAGLVAIGGLARLALARTLAIAARDHRRETGTDQPTGHEPA